MAEDDRSDRKSATSVGLVFGIYANTQVGESIRVIGESEELGKWNLDKSVQLRTDAKSYPMWTTAEPVWIQPKPGKKRLDPWMFRAGFSLNDPNFSTCISAYFCSFFFSSLSSFLRLGTPFRTIIRNKIADLGRGLQTIFGAFMRRVADPFLRGKLDAQTRSAKEYKYIRDRQQLGGGFVWEDDIPNRCLTMPAGGLWVVTDRLWNCPGATLVMLKDAESCDVSYRQRCLLIKPGLMRDLQIEQ